MALQELNTIYRYYIIGWSRYSFNGNEGLRMICCEDYPEQNDDQAGTNAMPVTGPYKQAHLFQGVPMSLGDPAVVEFEGNLVNRQGSPVLIATNVLKVTPAPSASKTASSSK